MSLDALIDMVPKAELHVHLFGTLEPELLFKIAKRNNIALPYKSIEEIRKNFIFKDLPSFIKMYDLGTSVFKTQKDFFDITYEYLKKCNDQNVKYVELIFDPQSHEPFGVNFETVFTGIRAGCDQAEKDFGVECNLILCFVRHLGLESALETLQQSVPYKDRILAIGLGGIERPFPPKMFREVYQKAKELGYRLSAHCGEEGDFTYIADGLIKLNLERIDHGVTCEEDVDLLLYLKHSQIPLTICPVSNVKIGLFKSLKDHNIKRLLDNGLLISLNSDDPSYFDCYLNDVYKETAKALNLTEDDIIKLAKNSFESSFLPRTKKDKFIASVDEALCQKV